MERWEQLRRDFYRWRWRRMSPEQRLRQMRRVRVEMVTACAAWQDSMLRTAAEFQRFAETYRRHVG